ncbi:VOC family protein [uncultured Hyphomonas sp.]|uniref:VOC family protein n=1 Tax=uncultured Hyphomonas sp. TaxID=225298 RepID=UPI002AAB1C20|nr:VOC family protein [uncultured Hyphomonas sp.]
MAKVIGVGGVFFHCADVEATRAWYKRVLGLEIDEYGGSSFVHADSVAQFPQGARTIWAPFKSGSDYFKPSNADFMINLMIDDFEGMLERLKAEGVTMEGEPMIESYGKFAWVMDPDGRKIELWQPVEPNPAA